jgi:hypothetical protein
MLDNRAHYTFAYTTSAPGSPSMTTPTPEPQSQQLDFRIIILASGGGLLLILVCVLVWGMCLRKKKADIDLHTPVNGVHSRLNVSGLDELFMEAGIPLHAYTVGSSCGAEHAVFKLHST